MSDVDITSAIETFVREWLYYLSIDHIGIGLGGITETGRLDHHLEGEDLVAYVHGVILGLASGGMTPQDDRFVTPDNPFGLVHFGADTPREIADGVVADWVASGMPDPDWGVWRMNTAKQRASLAQSAADCSEYFERWKRSIPGNGNE